MKNYLILLILLFLCHNVSAQKTGEEKLGSWYMFSGIHRISNKLSINSGAQIRDYETTSNFQQLLLLTGVSYNVNSNLTTSIGYGYLNTDKSFEELIDETNTEEHRLFQQVSLKNKLWKLKFEHRYRLEERFLDYNNRNNTQLRTRYRMQVTLPITDIFSIGVYDEVFLNLQGDVFSQNRLFAALGIKVSQNSKVQLGYLKNNLNNIVFNRLQLGLFIQTDLRNKNENQYVHNVSKGSNENKKRSDLLTD